MQEKSRREGTRWMLTEGPGPKPHDLGEERELGTWPRTHRCADWVGVGSALSLT